MEFDDLFELFEIHGSKASELLSEEIAVEGDKGSIELLFTMTGLDSPQHRAAAIDTLIKIKEMNPSLLDDFQDQLERLIK